MSITEQISHKSQNRQLYITMIFSIWNVWFFRQITKQQVLSLWEITAIMCIIFMWSSARGPCSCMHSDSPHWCLGAHWEVTEEHSWSSYSSTPLLDAQQGSEGREHNAKPHTFKMHQSASQTPLRKRTSICPAPLKKLIALNSFAYTIKLFTATIIILAYQVT